MGKGELYTFLWTITTVVFISKGRMKKLSFFHTPHFYFWKQFLLQIQLYTDLSTIFHLLQIQLSYYKYNCDFTPGPSKKDSLIEIFYLYRVRSCQIIFNVNSMIIGSEIDTGTYYYENRNDQNKNPFFLFHMFPLICKMDKLI